MVTHLVHTICQHRNHVISDAAVSRCHTTFKWIAQAKRRGMGYSVHRGCDRRGWSERLSDRAIERAIERATDRGIVRSNDRAIEQPSGRATERATDLTHRAIERSSDRTIEWSSVLRTTVHQSKAGGRHLIRQPLAVLYTTLQSSWQSNPAKQLETPPPRKAFKSDYLTCNLQLTFNW